MDSRNFRYLNVKLLLLHKTIVCSFRIMINEKKDKYPRKMKEDTGVKWINSVPSFQLVDYRVEFTKWWVTEFKTIKFPAQGTVFDYYIDPETHKFEPWNKMVQKFELDPDMPLQVNLDLIKPPPV